MEKIKRSIFFWSLVLLFFIVTPTVILQARGYRFDFHRGIFVHSGTITLKANPQNPEIFIDNSLEKSNLNRMNNTLNVGGLIPGNYGVKLAQDGFQTWEKKTDVHSGLANEFWNVLLVRNNYEQKNYNAASIDKFFISPKNKFIAYTVPADSATGVNILNINNSQITNNFSFSNASFSQVERKENIEWSPEEDYLSIPLKITSVSKTTKKSESRFFYFIADIANKTTLNLNELLKKDDIRNVRWDPQQKDFLFFLSENSLFRANIMDAGNLVLIAQDVSSYDLSRTGIYYAQQSNELVFKTSLDGQAEKMQLTDSFPGDIKNPNEKLIVYDEKRIVFLSSDKSLYIYNNGDQKLYFRKLADSIEGMQFSDDGKKLLYWTNNELSVYFLTNWDVQPTRSEDEVNTVTRFMSKIENVQWFKDYEHIIFNVGPQIKIVELDPRDHYVFMDIVKTASDGFIATYDNSLELLFFVDKKGEQTDLYSIIFPEKTTLFGF